MTDNAAGIRGAIAKLERLDDRGFPVEPAKQDNAAVSGAGVTPRGPGVDLDLLLGIDRGDPEQLAAIDTVREMIAQDRADWPEGHPCRDCDRLYREHSTYDSNCMGWR